MSKENEETLNFDNEVELKVWMETIQLNEMAER